MGSLSRIRRRREHARRMTRTGSHVQDGLGKAELRAGALEIQVRDLSRDVVKLRASVRDATTLIRDMKDALEELPEDDGNDLIRRAMLWLDPGRADAARHESNMQDARVNEVRTAVEGK